MTQTANTDRGSLSVLTSSAFLFNPIQATVQTTNDLPWMLRDDRQLMSDHAAGADTISLPHLVSLNDVPARSVPKVDAPDIVAVQSTDVNDLVIPLPVLHVGWAIALFATFFQLGSRLLRIRRAAAR